MLRHSSPQTTIKHYLKVDRSKLRRLRDVAPEELIRRPAPEKWSIAEIVAHLADAELAIAKHAGESGRGLNVVGSGRMGGALGRGSGSRARVFFRSPCPHFLLSISNGHGIIMDAMRVEPPLTPFLEQLRTLHFISDLDFSPKNRAGDQGIDGTLKVRTPKGTYSFLVEQKRSYLDRGILNALVAQAKLYARVHRKPLLLLARYIPRPSAERLIESRINFVDQAGNMHLVLGQNYERTIIGNKENAVSKEGKRVSPAIAQLLFTFATKELAGSWSVRQLAEASGLSKSNVANVRQQLVERGVLRESGHGFDISDKSRLQDELLRGYEFALRPKLLIGRFRSSDRDLGDMLASVRKPFADLSIRWSVTGGPAAQALQKFYRGLELPIFVDSFPDQLRRQLRIIPDKAGPLIFLRSFGTIPFWREIEPFPLAHPWLIYAELMYSSDPRAHEAAEELKREFLS